MPARSPAHNSIGLVAFCRGNTETAFLAKRAPEGLLAALLAGKTPDWMEIVPESRASRSNSTVSCR